MSGWADITGAQPIPLKRICVQCVIGVTPVGKRKMWLAYHAHMKIELKP